MSKIRPYVLVETNWKALKDASFDLVILPWGATEAHNYHLPYGTDNYEAEAIAYKSAEIAWKKGTKVIVLPPVPFGENTGQADIYLDINLNPSTQMAILDDIITVLDRQGIKKLMVLNSHGGNNFKPLLRELGLKFPNMFLCFSNWFQSLDKKDFFDNEGDHADEMETSIMLHLKPELVLDKENWGNGREKKHKIDAFKEGWCWAERKWSQISEDTGVGDPSQSTAIKGKSYFEAVTKKLGDFIFELAQADVEDLYE